MSNLKVWECQVCNWIYDEAKGHPEEGIEPGTRWEDIPDNWICPECGVGKSDFEMVDVSLYSAPELHQPRHVDDSSTIKSIPCKPIVIIGTGYAGYRLAIKLREQNTTTPIVMFTADSGDYYSKPKLSNACSEGRSALSLIQSSAEEMARRYSLEVVLYTEVKQIDTTSNRITFANGNYLFYSKLVLATGATSKQVSLNGNYAHRVFQVNNLSDYSRFRTNLEGKHDIVVMGGGLIGCEYADDLCRAGYNVTIVDPMPTALSGLLPEFAAGGLVREFERHGITCHFGRVISEVGNRIDSMQITLDDGTKLKADVILAAVGIKPNIALAKVAGLTCSLGIRVNRYLETSAKDVYAIGDCAQVEEQYLPYIAPITLQTNALSKTLLGERVPVHYGVMPVNVKTKLHPITVISPSNGSGQWVVDENDDTGVVGRCIDEHDKLIGLVLTGEKITKASGMVKQCANEFE
ncbi:FAD-dependent oxidoreductase [Vibrio sp. EA2]|uniref:FAD-dependent oxidoreductase n=1 Tax=Vibrio sp. EA2 TaxID=3079860 RepID=UPI00294942C2|nr:FAD-dependent oxidoreductase [Vibrio sp. EA2]MDV6253566.1 FAD-dependent oxidoreductase [Vibrio sp. EA2]